MKMERENLPKSVFEYFIKLYAIKYKDLNKKEIYRKAFRQWALLKKEDKEYVKKKFDECKKVYELKYGELLKLCEPYLKKKRKKVNHPVDSPKNIRNETSQRSDNNCITVTPEQQRLNESHESTAVNNETMLDMPPIIPIPADPPKNSRDLYEILFSTNEHATPWKQLSPAQKCHYTNAARTLKKTYIKKYREYLMSLSTDELYELYCKSSGILVNTTQHHSTNVL